MKEGHVAVVMRKDYLLQIATHGNMGSGEFSDLMKQWAANECQRLGLQDQLRAMVEEKLMQTRIRLRNLLGDDAVAHMDKGIELAKQAIKKSIGLDPKAANAAEQMLASQQVEAAEEKESQG